jgi:putative ABC transport system permease protein
VNRAALLESARIGADALRANPLRTVLSTTGVIIGVAALVAAFAVTDGVDVWARQLIARESSVQDVAVSSLTSQMVNGRSFPVRGYPVFDAEDATRARSEIPGVLRTALTLNGSAQVEHLDRRATVLLTLGTASLSDFGVPAIALGRFYTEPEVVHAAPVIVLGHKLAEELAGNRDALWMVGRAVRVSGQRREVIGVLAAPPGGEEAEFIAFAPIRGGTALLSSRARFQHFASKRTASKPSTHFARPL